MRMSNTIPGEESLERESTVKSYSEMGAREYDDPMNLGFLYGEVTVEFLKRIPFEIRNQRVLDIGCGTGLGFDVLGDKFATLDISGLGIEPAQGMLDIAKRKYAENSRFDFQTGSFESIPVPDQSIDRIISTLALHWVKDMDVAAAEMSRVIKKNGRLDILMIAKDDGAQFKKAIVRAQRKHLSFAQIMNTAILVQRLRADDARSIFARQFLGYSVKVMEKRNIVMGTFDEHMKWWKARSTPVIADVMDKDRFFADLREEMAQDTIDGRIPFDAAFLDITIKGD